MDLYSHRLANALVGNDREAATLEITLAGPVLEFDDERMVVVTGGDFEITVNAATARIDSPFLVRAGSFLRIGSRRRGARAYLAIGGGIDVPVVLGSRATHLPSGIGGCEGRPLRVGDVLPLGMRPLTWSSVEVGWTAPNLRHGGLSTTVRVIPGPEQHRFPADALARLQSDAYRIDGESDRMGYRLSGPSIARPDEAAVISDAVPFGGIQVPASGQPILLMADRPTTGGYPILATVVSGDLGLVGQLAPGDAIRFVVTTPRDALATLIAQEGLLMAIESDTLR
jgi:antagonist of KipI